MSRAILQCALLAIVLAAGADPPADPPPPSSDAGIVLEIQRLMAPDTTIEDPTQQRQALVAGLRRIPSLLEAMEKDHPRSKYIAVAYSLAMDAMVLRRQHEDPSATCDELSALARRLLAVADDDESRAKARFALLEVEAVQLLGDSPAPTTTASAPSTTASASRPGHAAALAAIARKFVALADEFPGTLYAPACLFQGGGLYLEGDHDAAAIAAFDRLSRDYPKDPFSLKALMILVQLHTAAGRSEQSLAAKRRVVEQFTGSAAAIKYGADIARAECVGKPFFLRFRCVLGRQVNARDHRGKTLLVYFYDTILEKDSAEQVAREMVELARLAGERGCVLLAVGADRAEDAEKVAALLRARKIETPNLLDADSQVARNYGVLFVPAVVVVDPQGNLKDVVSDADIVAAVGKVIAPGGSSP